MTIYNMYGHSGSASKRPRLDSFAEQSQNDWDDDLPGEVFEEVCMMVEQSQMENTDEKRLRDQLKTKEGEIAILRAKLRKESEDLAAVKRCAQNAEVVHTEALNALKRQLTAELEFKDMEINSLSNRCKELEVKGVNGKIAVSKNPQIEEKKFIDNKTEIINLGDLRIHEGNRLAGFITSEFFAVHVEPNPLLIFEGTPCKARWEHVPIFRSRIKETFPIILTLFHHGKLPEDLIKNLLELIQNILKDYLTVLRFLAEESGSGESKKCNFPLPNGKKLLAKDFLCNCETGVEVRRLLSMFSFVLIVKRDFHLPVAFLAGLKEIVICVRKIQRPEKFSGILISICFLLQSVSFSNPTVIKLAQCLFEEIIFCKPSISVNLALLKGFSAFLEFSPCRQIPTDDERNFACPLKYLLGQLKLEFESEWFFDLSEYYINWLLHLCSKLKKKPNWLLPNDENCCNLISFTFNLLDRLLEYLKQGDSGKSLRVLERGLVAIFDICKGSDKLTLQHLKYFPESLRQRRDCFKDKPREAADWLVNIYDYQISNLETFKHIYGSTLLTLADFETDVCHSK